MQKINFETTLRLLGEKLWEWYETIIAHIPNVIFAAIIIFIFGSLAKTLKKTVAKYLPKVSQNKSINSLALNVISIGTMLIGAFFALEVVGLDKAVTSILAGAGVVGIALGFAFQEIASNFISGVLIALSEPYELGDIVEVENTLGEVTDIELRITTITTFDGLEVLIPNKDMFTKPVTNYTRTPKRRVDIPVGVSYGDNLHRVEEVTIAALSKMENLIPGHQIELFYTEFGDSSINFTVRYWIKYNGGVEYLRAKHLGIKMIKDAFDANDITIPFPIRTLDFGIKGGTELKAQLSAEVEH